MSNNNGNNVNNGPTWTEIGLRRTGLAQQELINIQQIRLNHQANSVARADSNKDSQDNLHKRLQASEGLNQYYKNLLSKPLAQIASENADFKLLYDEQQLLIADWMVSQKAFKELAISFGHQLGKQTTDIIQQGASKKLDVLEDKHDATHGTNANDGEFISSRKEKLIAKIRNK